MKEGLVETYNRYITLYFIMAKLTLHVRNAACVRAVRAWRECVRDVRVEHA